MNTKQIGNFGERIGENYLKDKGYQILDKNYYFRTSGGPQRGEIDIVAKKGDIICFFEVKTLKEGSFISPEEKVSFQKQRKLRMMAESWLMAKRIPLNSKWQIDVISVMIDKRGKAKISHFENVISQKSSFS
jgi:putative endonuclease